MKKFCPICAAVVVTWIALFVLLRLGFNVDTTLLAILMGMSVGAIAAKYAAGMAQKTGMVILGGGGALALINNKIGPGLLLIAATLALIGYKRQKNLPKPDRFEDCC